MRRPMESLPLPPLLLEMGVVLLLPVFAVAVMQSDRRQHRAAADESDGPAAAAAARSQTPAWRMLRLLHWQWRIQRSGASRADERRVCKCRMEWNGRSDAELRSHANDTAVQSVPVSTGGRRRRRVTVVDWHSGHMHSTSAMQHTRYQHKATTADDRQAGRQIAAVQLEHARRETRESPSLPNKWTIHS